MMIVHAKHFLDLGAGAIFGFDYCFWPNGASAYSFTLGSSYGIYGGYDDYWCLDSFLEEGYRA